MPKKLRPKAEYVTTQPDLFIVRFQLLSGSRECDQLRTVWSIIADGQCARDRTRRTRTEFDSDGATRALSERAATRTRSGRDVDEIATRRDGAYAD